MIGAAQHHAPLGELLAEYFARVDRIVPSSPADTFATNGRLRVGALARDGRAAIADYFARRRAEEDASGRKTRHVMSNLVVECCDQETASVRLQAQVFAGVGEFPLPSAAPATIADFEADCTIENGAWRLLELRACVTFTGANAATFAR